MPVDEFGRELREDAASSSSSSGSESRRRRRRLSRSRSRSRSPRGRGPPRGFGRRFSPPPGRYGNRGGNWQGPRGGGGGGPPPQMMDRRGGSFQEMGDNRRGFSPLRGNSPLRRPPPRDRDMRDGRDMQPSVSSYGGFGPSSNNNNYNDNIRGGSYGSFGPPSPTKNHNIQLGVGGGSSSAIAPDNMFPPGGGIIMPATEITEVVMSDDALQRAIESTTAFVEQASIAIELQQHPPVSWSEQQPANAGPQRVVDQPPMQDRNWSDQQRPAVSQPAQQGWNQPPAADSSRSILPSSQQQWGQGQNAKRQEWSEEGRRQPGPEQRWNSGNEWNGGANRSNPPPEGGGWEGGWRERNAEPFVADGARSASGPPPLARAYEQSSSNNNMNNAYNSSNNEFREREWEEDRGRGGGGHNSSSMNTSNPSSNANPSGNNNNVVGYNNYNNNSANGGDYRNGGSNNNNFSSNNNNNNHNGNNGWRGDRAAPAPYGSSGPTQAADNGGKVGVEGGYHAPVPSSSNYHQQGGYQDISARGGNGNAGRGGFGGDGYRGGGGGGGDVGGGRGAGGNGQWQQPIPQGSQFGENQGRGGSILPPAAAPALLQLPLAQPSLPATSFVPPGGGGHAAAPIGGQQHQQPQRPPAAAAPVASAPAAAAVHTPVKQSKPESGPAAPSSSVTGSSVVVDPVTGELTRVNSDQAMEGLTKMKSMIVNYVKEVITPLYRNNKLTKSQFKTVAKKATDKVFGTEAKLQPEGYLGPTEQFLTQNRRANIKQVVHSYVQQAMQFPAELKEA